MKHSKTLLAASLSAAMLSGIARADAPAEGCYRPVRGFATSICTDQVACSTQAGIYRLVLRNNDAPWGERRLVIKGTFNGTIVSFDEQTGVSTLNHVLVDASAGGQIFTGPDTGIPVGGDGVTELKVQETLSVRGGVGAFAGIQPGGTITLRGTLGLQTGVNTFVVDRQPGDAICFAYD